MLQIFKHYLRSSPRLYSFVYWICFNLSPVSLYRKWSDYVFHPEHRRNSIVLAGPNFMGYKGGVLNPGALTMPNGNILLLAKAQVCHWWTAVGIKADEYFKGNAMMIVLNERLDIVSSRQVEMDSSFPSDNLTGYEDFRLFRYGNEIWANHGMISIQKKHQCASTYIAATPCLSRLDTKSGELSFLGHPRVDFPTGMIEKNWLFFEHDKSLYLLYTVNPYRLLKLKDAKTHSFETIIHEDLGSAIKDIGGFGTMISFSTNPVEYDDDYLLFLIHQVERRGRERFYHHWGFLLDKRTLRPAKITKKPLFTGEGARGKRPGIIFVTSVLKRQNEFVFLLGEGDAYLTYTLLGKDKLDLIWKNIYD